MRPLFVLVGAALVACGEARSPAKPSGGASSGAGDAPEDSAPASAAASAPAPAPTAAPPGPVSSSAMPPPTPKKAGCLDSTRGAKHTFVGKLEKHPDGSGAVRVHLPKKVCFSGGRFSQGETDEVILDIDDGKAKPLLEKKVKVSGTSQDFAPLDRHAYVMRLEVTSLVASKGAK
jgi:hypothetical protein